jgi:signal transduction histidine kinase
MSVVGLVAATAVDDNCEVGLKQAMKQRLWFFFILELLAVMGCLFLGLDVRGFSAFFAYALICACLLTTKLLLEMLRVSVWPARLCALLCVAVLFFYGSDALLPLVVVLMGDILGKKTEPLYALSLTLVAAVLLAFIVPQRVVSLLIAAAEGILAFAGLLLTRLLIHLQAELGSKDERINALQARLEGQRDTISAIEQQSRQAERNRLAARIHDRVGHGITGSILLLEAARLQWDTDAPCARTNIEKATKNLRETVDGIRRELRDERSADKQASLTCVAAELDAFADEHVPIVCDLETSGALEALPQLIWVCIHESLRETLTNLLKHSNASRFRALISHHNRLIYVEFSDNGSTVQTEATGLLERGIGLAAIQERAALAGGRAFFSLTALGFTTKLTFPLKG